LERYLKPRYLDWVKAGGYRLYQGRKGWLENTFYIDLWKVIEGKENRLLETDTRVMIPIQQSKNLQEQEGKLPSKKEEQEKIKGDILRRETQRISTSCLNMLIQGATKKQMKEIMRMWTQISLIHLKTSRTQHNSLI
jgi:hypothetical protein